jgi:antitoxin HigA-1
MLIPENREPTPPGEMLSEEFMKPLGITQTMLAHRLHIGRDGLNDIIRGRRRITPSTALRLSKAFGTGSTASSRSTSTVLSTTRRKWRPSRRSLR